MSEVEEKIDRNGKGSLYRIPVGDPKYKENYNRIFRKKDEQRFKLGSHQETQDGHQRPQVYNTA